MAQPPQRSERLRAALKRLGNPYACLQVEEVAAATVETADDDAVRQYVRRSENPYASLGVTALADAVPTPVAGPHVALRASKEHFRMTARRIFRGYIPAAEKEVLRPHHRDFISRNENRSADERASLLAHLARYDLADLPLRAHFNRERDPFTAGKLSQIERDALGKPRP